MKLVLSRHPMHNQQVDTICEFRFGLVSLNTYTLFPHQGLKMSRHMWRDHQLPRGWKRLLVLVEVLGALTLTAYTTLISLPESKPNTLRSDVVGAADSVPFGLILAIGCATLIAILIVRYSDHRWNPQRPYVYSILRGLEPDLWAKPVKELVGGPHKHRMTLFQLKKRSSIRKFFSKSKASHMLVPRARLPINEGRAPKHTWLADDHHDNLCQGIAGLVFSLNGSVATEDLPDISGPECPDELLEDYAARTHDTIDSVKRGDIFSRIIGGLPIRVPNGGRWGVLVVDSADPKAVDPQTWQEEKVQHRIMVLSSLLSEVK